MTTPCSRRIRISSPDGSAVPARLIKMASETRIGSPKIASPACFKVFPVETTSAMRSATPRRTLLSTAPSSRTTEALMFRSLRRFSTSPGYAVATLLPEISAIFQVDEAGAAKRKVDPPKSRAKISSASAPESIKRSRPVIPASSSPEPT